MLKGCSPLASEFQHSVVGGLKVLSKLFNNLVTLLIDFVDSLSRVRVHNLLPSKLIRKDVSVLALTKHIGRHYYIAAQ